MTTSAETKDANSSPDKANAGTEAESPMKKEEAAAAKTVKPVTPPVPSKPVIGIKRKLGGALGGGFGGMKGLGGSGGNVLNEELRKKLFS